MKNSRFDFQYRESASKLHIAIGECLRSSDIFGRFNIYQEYPVVRVNPTYKETSHHFDWVIPDIYLVIEGHGQQHYDVVTFGADLETAMFSFQAGKRRDAAKKDAALEAGYTLIEVPYWDEDNITDGYLWELYELNKNPDPPAIEVTSPRKKYLKSERHQEELEKARQYRKEQYARMKGLK